MSIIQRMPWKVQPQVPVTINQSNPLCNGIVSAILLRPNDTRDIVIGKFATKSPSLTSGVNKDGQYINSAASCYVDLGSVPPLGRTNPCTIAWTQEPRGSIPAYAAALQIQFGTAGADQVFLVLLSSTDSGYYFNVGPCNGASVGFGGTVGAMTAGVVDRYVLRCNISTADRTGAGYDLFRNGVKIAGTTSSSFSSGTAAGATLGAGLDHGSPFFGLYGNFTFWNRALQDAEARSWCSNPWQIFAPLPRRIWAPSAGGGPTYTLPASTTSFALSGTATSLKFNRALAAVSGSFALSGTAAALKFNRSLTAGSGSFLLSGTNTSLKFNRVLSAGSGVFLLTGTDSTLTYSGAGGPTYTLSVTNGNFALTGTNVTFNRNRVIQLGNGSFTLNGTNATLTYSGAPAPAGAILYLDLISGKVLLLKQL